MICVIRGWVTLANRATPVINKNRGRDHWPQVAYALLAGGGLRTGQVIGATNCLSEYPQERPVHFQEVFVTLYHNLGIDVSRTTLSDRSDPAVSRLIASCACGSRDESAVASSGCGKRERNRALLSQRCGRRGHSQNWQAMRLRSEWPQRPVWRRDD